MADMLATKEDLAILLERRDIRIDKATMLIEMATSIVQGVAEQRIVEATSTVDLDGTGERYLWLPQLPVQSVDAVELDGTALDAEGWRLVGHRIYRGAGWQGLCSGPSTVAVTYRHGLPADDQGIQLARSAVLSLVASVYDNPTGMTRESIDDYTRAYEAMSARMDASPFLQQRLLKQYGRPAAAVSLGG